MYDPNSLLIFSHAAPAIDPRELTRRYISDQSDVIVRWHQVQAVTPPDFRVCQYTVPQQEPSRSPSLAVISPLVEDSGNGGFRSRRKTTGIAVRSTGEDQGTRRHAARPGKRRRRLRRWVTDSGTLQRDAAERVQFLDAHCDLRWVCQIQTFRPLPALNAAPLIAASLSLSIGTATRSLNNQRLSAV